MYIYVRTDKFCFVAHFCVEGYVRDHHQQTPSIHTKFKTPHIPRGEGFSYTCPICYMGRSRGLVPFKSQSPALLGKVSDSLSNRTFGWDF